ncbi:anti-anti-sigma regulatory factor/anti-sigma regulatory factor (Ser/Thr protein kinase) [Crossiella equi]|uniref:Anti-anti-sigma regulatory factor/anti-sigma regulatory factor (Ser/Thr protein kinase) n=1 Tax=Crossiella equi TaxID=130796 RepID=A0ABS5A9N7_9PSEU|nr:STAS domain-containing protein [Crossiella equi]MBP2473001.1 anti-anti-sigma regulatory factor/anti-sigma regulatory factor (Ser/Thr protein kinase) [Crossiella equi]
MRAELSCTPEDLGGATLLRVDGVLTVASASILRSAAAKCLAEQPTGLVLELSGLVLDDRVALMVLAAVRRRAMEWPGVPVGVCSVSGTVREAMWRIGLSRRLPVFDSPAAARRALAGEPRPERLSEWFTPSASACSRARHLVIEACRRWDVPQLAERGAAVVDELVTNAVTHAGTPLQLTATVRGAYLCLSVRDGSRTAPRAVRRVSRRGRRGLVLVAEYATAWGHLSAADGKVVWATLRTRHSGGDANTP